MATMRRICAAGPAALVLPARHSGRALGRSERNQQPADASQPPGPAQMPLATRKHSAFLQGKTGTKSYRLVGFIERKIRNDRLAHVLRNGVDCEREPGNRRKYELHQRPGGGLS